jgi:squalene-hopene/tetraprenyl-beta-curcumene cyclase
MKRIVLLLCLFAVLPLLPAADKDLRRPGPNRPDEPLTKLASLEQGVQFLDAVALHWTQQQKCATCHTNVPYLLARPALGGKTSTAERTVRTFFEQRVANWDRGGKGDKPRWDTEVVVTAATLALHDAATTGKLHPLTRQALDRMWTVQQKNGAWNWLKCNWPPFEHDDYYGAVFAAVGVGAAPDDYAQSASAKAGVARLRDYLRRQSSPTLHHSAWLLWASLRLDGLLDQAQQQKIVQTLLSVQRPDGGWSLPSLGDWKGYDGRDNDVNAPSDGYATGFVVHVLRQAGLPKDHAAIRKGADWLRKNQRVSGRYFTRSLNRDTTHYISNAGSAFALLALKECE